MTKEKSRTWFRNISIIAVLIVPMGAAAFIWKKNQTEKVTPNSLYRQMISSDSYKPSGDESIDCFLQSKE